MGWARDGRSVRVAMGGVGACAVVQYCQQENSDMYPCSEDNPHIFTYDDGVVFGDLDSADDKALEAFTRAIDDWTTIVSERVI